jgi:hypothetical protein
VRLLSTGEGPAIKFAVVAALLLLVAARFLKKRQWRQLRVFYALLGTLGFLVVEFFLILIAWSWHGFTQGGRLVGAQTVLLGVQTLALAITAVFVIWCAIAAHRSAEATQHQAEATLASYAPLLVVDPIKTVGDYVCEGKLPGLSKDKYGWLVIEMQNVGSMRAWNIRAGRSEWMQRDVRCFEDWEEKGGWRAGCVPPDEPRFFYFPPPGKATHTGFSWYNPLYYPWQSHVEIHKEEGTWHTAWDHRPQRHWRLLHED